MPHPVAQKWLTAAEYAKADPSLIPNHKGIVDKALKGVLVENTKLLDTIAGCSGLEDVQEDLETENAAINAALAIYA